ncbi:MAG: GlsB/YeaQ/YmgE family stress response membrane protein [Gemmatimonadota bacterium]
MDIIGLIIFGGIVGALGKLIMPGKDPGGCIVTIILGILGSVVGGYLFRWLNIGGEGLARWLGAVLGVVILLLLYRMFVARRPPPA